MFINFGETLLNTLTVNFFQIETRSGTWRISAYANDNSVASESFGTSEEMAKARMKMLEEQLK